MNIRKMAYLTMDKIIGRGNLHKDLCEISQIVESNGSNNEALDRLIRHATKTVEAYRNIGEDAKLSDFPIVNKNILRDTLEQHISDKYDKTELACLTTSGSTGTPFKIYYDRRKSRRHRAALMYWNERAGAELGQRLYYLRVWNNMNKKGKLSQFIENIIPVEVSRFGREEVNRFLKKIGHKRSAILGFSSAISDITRNAEVFPVNLKCILAMSEHLSEAVRQEATAKFHCPVYARYSNMENGFIAQQFDDSGEYLINTADYIIELLHPDKDEPVADGTLGRIVVTDLYNYAMPFIRYDTGDMGVARTRPDGKRVLVSVEGRRSDIIYDVFNRPVSSHTISITLWHFPEIVQFQFVQKDKGKYLMLLNMRGKTFNRESELRDRLEQYIGAGAVIEFKYVNEIPVLNSGKRRYIINEYAGNIQSDII